MKPRCPTMGAALFALAILVLSPVALAVDPCTDKTPPAPSACYSVGRCDPATGEFALTDKAPSTSAPACKVFTTCVDGVWGTKDLPCPTGQGCSLATGRCALPDKCSGWMEPLDADKCNTHSCDPLTGATRTARKTCDAGLFCGAITGQCNPICVDNDRTNDEAVLGQVTIKGEVSSIDRCTRDGNLEQVGCDAGGTAKVYAAKPCLKGTCRSGTCVDLCTKVPADDLCTDFSCDPLTGDITRAAVPPPAINACQTVSACDATMGYKVERKPTPPPIDICHTPGSCNAGEFAQNLVTCPAGQECNVQAGGCVAINRCTNKTYPADRCNTYSCDPPTGDITKLPIQPPPITACQTVRACDIATGYTVIDKTCPAGQECSVRSGECVAITTHPPADAVAATTAEAPATAPPPSDTTTTSAPAETSTLAATIAPPDTVAANTLTAAMPDTTVVAATPSTITATTPTVAESATATAAPLETSTIKATLPESTATITTPPMAAATTTTVADRAVAPISATVPTETSTVTTTNTPPDTVAATTLTAAMPDTTVTAATPSTITPTVAEQQAARDRLTQQLVQITEPSERLTTITTETSDPTEIPATVAEQTTSSPTTALLDCSNPQFATDNPGRCTPATEQPTITAKLPDPDIQVAQPTDLAAAQPEVAAATTPDTTADTEPTTTTDTKPQTTDDGPNPDATDCPLRARRICAQTTSKDMLLLTGFDIREKFTTDNATAIALDTPEVQQTLALVGENFTDPRYAAEYSKDDERSRLAYCIGRVTQFCKRPEADRKFVLEDCSDPRFAEENTSRCPLQPRRQASCTGDNSTLLPSTSSIFEVKSQVMSLPAMFKAEQVGDPQLMESPENPLQQYILIPKDTAIATGFEVLVIDPLTGLVRMLGLDKGQLSVVKDANGIGTILMVVNSDGIKYFNAWETVAGYMKDAVPIDQAFNTQGPTMLTDTAASWNTVAIPTDELILSAQPNDKGVIVVTATAAGTLKGIWYFASLSDANGKFIPFAPETAGFTLRKAIFTPGNGKLAVDMVLKSKDEAILQPTITHSDDILAEPPTFIVQVDQATGTKALKKAISDDWANKSAEKASSKKKTQDKDPFLKSLSEAISNGKVGIPAVSYGFTDNGEELGTLVIQPNGLDFYKMDNGAIVKNDDFLSAGTEGEVCRKTRAVLAVDTNTWGGKDVAQITDNGETISIAFHSNINTAPQIVTAKATTVAEGVQPGIQLDFDFKTEESEALTFVWKAYKVMPDGSLTDVSSQLDDPTKRNPTFKLDAVAPMTTLMKKSSILDTAVDWLVAQISISTAFAQETPTTTTTADYIFSITATDPLGAQAGAQIMAKVTAQASTTTTDTVTTFPTLKIVVEKVEMLTPQKEESKAQTIPTATTTPTEKPLYVGTSLGEGTPPTRDEPAATKDLVDTKSAASADGLDVAAEGGSFNCALTRHTAPPSPPLWLWILPLLAFIPMRATCCRK